MRKKIINKLLDKYERSILSTKGSKQNLKIEIKPSQIFKHYGHSRYYKETSQIEEATRTLQEASLVYTIILNDLIQTIGLDLNHIQDGYSYVKRIPKRNNQQQALDFLSNIYHPASHYLQSKINNHESVARYFDISDLRFLEDIFKLISFIENTKAPISYRRASQQLYQDSKRLNSIERSTINLLTDSKLVSVDSNIFNISAIYKNRDFIYLKGSGKLKVNNTSIRLEDFCGGFALSTDDVHQIEWESHQLPTILSIENLTTFHDTFIPNTLIVYLAGYHNTLKETFFKNLYKANPKSQYFHFGDIDAGGFQIYYNLVEKTNIPFDTFKMDSQTLLEYIDYSKPLTQNDRKALQRLYKKTNLKVIEIMLEKNIKLEQEIVEV